MKSDPIGNREDRGKVAVRLGGAAVVGTLLALIQTGRTDAQDLVAYSVAAYALMTTMMYLVFTILAALARPQPSSPPEADAPCGGGLKRSEDSKGRVWVGGTPESARYGQAVPASDSPPATSEAHDDTYSSPKFSGDE
jgi:hypothetical protein